jgi:putative glutamine amidotransferase
MQGLNLAHNGTLYQHLPDDIESDVPHKQDLAYRHRVTVERASRLGDILLANQAESVIAVNTSHHQAVNHLGSDLMVVARADDGLIEAIETTDPRWFAIGVQWHAETLDSPELFGAFVEAARYPDLAEVIAA